jgi:hypothetical protein
VNDPVLNKIQAIALKTREWAINTRTDDFSEHLAGMCAIASAELFKRLKAEGFKPKICFTEEHTFILVDGLVVDVTATQFGSRYKPVSILPFEEAVEDGVWGMEIEYSTRSLKSAAEFQAEVGWPKYQRITIR